MTGLQGRKKHGRALRDVPTFNCLVDCKALVVDRFEEVVAGLVARSMPPTAVCFVLLEQIHFADSTLSALPAIR